jgi:hypothetical protein
MGSCIRSLPFDPLVYLAGELAEHFVATALSNNALLPTRLGELAGPAVKVLLEIGG